MSERIPSSIRAPPDAETNINGVRRVIGFQYGYEGLVARYGHARFELTPARVSRIHEMGGTVLGSSRGPQDIGEMVDTLDREGIGMLFTVGGDGTMTISSKLMELGANIVGVPKTIDNDLAATDITFGHDSAVYVATEAIDRLHTTASSHHRVMIIELMGRYAGWIALSAGLAGGADIILIPEIPFQWDHVFRKLIERSRHGKRFSIICVAEGACCPDCGEIVKAYDQKRTDAKQLGGVGEYVGKHITECTGLETRVTVLGHLQRGGSPTPFDRILATGFGVAACWLAMKGRFGQMVALHGNKVESVPIKDAIAHLKLVTPQTQKVLAARSVGTSFGDA